MIGLEARLHHCREVAALLTSLVDGNANRGETGEVHKQVVDQVAEVAVVVFADDAAQGNAVDAAEGMVGDEGVELAVVLVGQVLKAFELQRHLQIVHTCLQPRCSLQLAAFPEEGVHLVLMSHFF